MLYKRTAHSVGTRVGRPNHNDKRLAPMGDLPVLVQFTAGCKIATFSAPARPLCRSLHQSGEPTHVWRRSSEAVLPPWPLRDQLLMANLDRVGAGKQEPAAFFRRQFFRQGAPSRIELITRRDAAR